MIKIGKLNQLTVSKITVDTVWLDGGESGEIKLTDSGLQPGEGETLTVLVYTDGKGQLLATVKQPLAMVGEVAWLKVVAVSRAGAFLDWGIPKDVLVPFSEQKQKMLEGRFYLVRLYLDEDNRIAASTRLDDFVRDEAIYLKDGQAVDLIIADETDLGVKAIVNNEFWGVLYKSELFRPVKPGQRLKGFIKKIREDNKIDLCLSLDNHGQQVDSVSAKILQRLEKQGGVLDISDKSPPELIYKTFAVSKKVFKQAIGHLYKKRQITIDKNCIRLTKNDD
jgi:uncharacterized protein